MRLPTRTLVIATALALASMGLQHKHDHGPGGHHHDHNDLNGAFSKLPELSTFAGLVKAADLEDTLEEKGPYTVFAPTDDAFNKLSEKQLEELSDPKNKSKLKAILQRHIVKADLAPEALKGEQKAMAKDTKLVFAKDGEKTTLSIPGATPKAVVAKSFKVDNGHLHTVDAVLLP